MTARWVPAVLAVALAASATLRAEVRLQPDSSGPALRVIPTVAGPWTPVGPVGDRVLNPSGDQVGDGLPTWAARSGDLLVAWPRQSEPSLGLAHGRGRWLATVEVATSRLAGQPAVVPAGDGWLVAWESCDGPSVLVAAVVVRASGSLAISPVEMLSDDAVLAGAFPLGEDALVAWQTQDGQLAVAVVGLQSDDAGGDLGGGDEPRVAAGAATVVFAGGLPDPSPTPFPDLSTGRGSWRWSTLAAPQGAGGAARPSAVSGTSAEPCTQSGGQALRMDLHLVRRGPVSRSVLTFWRDPWTVGHVAVTPEGAAGETRLVRRPGGPPWSPALIQAALAAHRD